MVVLVVRRELNHVPESPPQDTAPTPVDDWDQLLAAGVRMGPRDAALTIIVFSDFECPACRAFHETTAALRAKYPDAVAVVHVHHPLARHRLANAAARAAECAADQGVFEAFHDLLFERQDSLGIKSWVAFASSAAVGNLQEFERCFARTEPHPRIEAGLALGRQLELEGTPLVVVNGMRHRRVPSLDELEERLLSYQGGAHGLRNVQGNAAGVGSVPQ
jgi:protein-disulfide isomerase